MEAATQAPRRVSGVEFQALGDGSGVLVDGAGNSYALNATGADVWQLCDGRTDATTMVARLMERYEAPEDDVRRGVAALLHELRRLGVIEQ
jgi:hypothetical protein